MNRRVLSRLTSLPIADIHVPILRRPSTSALIQALIISHLDNKRSYNSPSWIHPAHSVRCKVHLHVQPKMMKTAYTHYWAHLVCLVPWYMLFIYHYVFITILRGKYYYFTNKSKDRDKDSGLERLNNLPKVTQLHGLKQPDSGTYTTY